MSDMSTADSDEPSSSKGRHPELSLMQSTEKLKDHIANTVHEFRSSYSESNQSDPESNTDGDSGSPDDEVHGTPSSPSLSAEVSTSSTSSSGSPPPCEEQQPLNGLTSVAALTSAELAARREASRRSRIRAAERSKAQQQQQKEDLEKKKRLNKRHRPRPKPKPRKAIRLQPPQEDHADCSLDNNEAKVGGYFNNHTTPRHGCNNATGPNLLSPTKSVGSEATTSLCSPRISQMCGRKGSFEDGQSQHPHDDIGDDDSHSDDDSYEGEAKKTRSRENYRRWLASIKSYNSKLEEEWQRNAAEEQDRLFREAQARMAEEIERERRRKDELRQQEESNSSESRRKWLYSCGWDDSILKLENNDLVPDVSAHEPLVCLGLGCKATDNDIRRRFKKLALMFHPDKNKLASANEAFCAFSAAYKVLALQVRAPVSTRKKTTASKTCSSAFDSANHGRSTMGQEQGLYASSARRQCFPTSKDDVSKDRSESFASGLSSISSRSDVYPPASSP